MHTRFSCWPNNIYVAIAIDAVLVVVLVVVVEPNQPEMNKNESEEICNAIRIITIRNEEKKKKKPAHQANCK